MPGAIAEDARAEMNTTLSTKARRVKQALGQSLARKPAELADEILLKNRLYPGLATSRVAFPPV